MNQLKSIIYINYSPYENSGHILDYLLEHFNLVFLFSLGFYDVGKGRKNNALFIYKNGKKIKEILIFQFSINYNLVFLFIPIRSLISLVEVLWYSLSIKRKYGKVDIFFTVNGFTAWIGILLRVFRIVNKSIFWVWDYYPPHHESFVVRIMRSIYWQFDKMGSKSDKVIFINKRLMNLHKQKGSFPKDKDYLVVPIGIKPFKNLKPKSRSKVIFGFIGVLKKSQGLDMVFDNHQTIYRNYPDAIFEIIGSGPDEEYFKNRAKKCSVKINFHGYLEGDKFYKILQKCTIGIATYIPDESNVSHFGDPGKVKRYLTLAIPTITTNVFEFSKEIEDSGAGVVIKYNDSQSFVEAISKIKSNYYNFSKDALKLSKKFNYNKIYKPMFE